MTLYQLEMMHRSLVWKSIQNGRNKTEKKQYRDRAKKLEGVIKERLYLVMQESM